MAVYAVICTPASDGVAVAPCGTVEGVGYAPSMDAQPSGELDYSQLGPVFAWVFSCIMIAWVIGLTVGSIVRVIRSA